MLKAVHIKAGLKKITESENSEYPVDEIKRAKAFIDDAFKKAEKSVDFSA